MKTTFKTLVMATIVAASAFLTSCTQEPTPGRVSFWVQNDLGGGGNISVKIDGYATKTITGFYPGGITSCTGNLSTADYTLNPGSYNYTAANTDSSLTWSGTATITDNGCATIKLTN